MCFLQKWVIPGPGCAARLKCGAFNHVQAQSCSCPPGSEDTKGLRPSVACRHQPGVLCQQQKATLADAGKKGFTNLSRKRRLANPGAGSGEVVTKSWAGEGVPMDTELQGRRGEELEGGDVHCTAPMMCLVPPSGQGGKVLVTRVSPPF